MIRMPIISGVGVVALNRKLGCLEDNLSSDSLPVQLIGNVNAIFKALNDNEMNLHWWKFYKTKSYSSLETHHQAFVE